MAETPITATYVSTTSFSVAADKAAEFSQGVRVKADCGVDGTKYGTVSSVAQSVVSATRPVTSGSDDGHWPGTDSSYSGFNNSNGNMYLGYYSATETYRDFILFTSVPIAKNETASNGHISFKFKSYVTDAVTVRIHVVLDDNPYAPPTGYDCKNLSLSSEYVEWTIPSGLSDLDSISTPDISSLVTLIAARSSWVSGNSMLFVVKPVSPTSTQLVYLYTYNGGQAPSLSFDIPSSTYTVALALDASTLTSNLTSVLHGNDVPASLCHHGHTGAGDGGAVAYSSLSGTPTIPSASSTTPAALGTAAVGTGTTFARADHVHTLPTPANVGAMSTSHAANAITGLASAEPAAVSSSTSGAVGTSTLMARQDHGHDLSIHAHTGATDGGQIAHTALSSIGTNTHAQIDTFIGTKAAASGLASLNASSLVVQDPANATATATASKIPVADGSGKLDTWISDASTSVAGKVALATATPAALGTAAAGSGTTAAKADHVHPTTGVMTTTHSANSITGFGTPATSVSTSTSAAAGTATTIARSDHNHNLGTHTHAGTTTGGQIAYSALTGAPTIPVASSTTPAALGTAAVGSGTTFARADHVHTLPTAANVGALASGADINLSDYKVQRPYLQDWAEVVNARGSISGAQTIDLELGNVVTATITAATTFTFSNPPATGRAGGFVLVLTNGGAGTITWPTAAKWAAGTAPTLTASGVDLLAFTTVDAGTTWRGVCVAKDVK